MRLKNIFSIILAIIVSSSGIAAFADSDKEIKVGIVEMTETLTVRVGQVRTITVLISPTNADNKTLTWTSSDEEVVTIVEDGVVAGVSPGTAIVTAESANGRTAHCTVTVPSKKLDGIDLDTDMIDLPSYGKDSMLITANELRDDVEKAVKKTPKGQKAVISYNDKSKLSAAALRSAAYAAQSATSGVSLVFNTTNGKNSVQGQIRIDPALAKKTDKDIKPGVYTSAEKTAIIRDALSGVSSGLAGVIRCEQQGSYGMIVEIAAKVDLSGLDSSKLYIYLYDTETQSWKRLQNTAHWVDTSGYLHFSTAYGGYIAVSSKAWNV